MNRQTFFFWLHEAGLFLAVSGCVWRLYDDIILGIFAALAVGALLFRVERIVKSSPSSSAITVNNGGQVTFGVVPLDKSTG